MIDSCFDSGRREEGLCLWVEVKFCSVQVRPLVMSCQKRTFTEKQEDTFYHHGRSLYTVVMQTTMWAWIDIYGNWHEAFMGILWLFPPQYCSSMSQCLTSTGKACRPLSSLHRCVLLLQLFLVLRAGREWVCAGIFLAAVARLSSVLACMLCWCVQIIGESKWCLFTCIYIEEPHRNAHVQTLAAQLHTTLPNGT